MNYLRSCCPCLPPAPEPSHYVQDDIDDLEFENLLSGATRIPRARNNIQDYINYILSYFRGPRRGTGNRTGYQSVPRQLGTGNTSNRVNNLYNNDSESDDEDFFITDANAAELTSEQIQKITSFASSQIKKISEDPPLESRFQTFSRSQSQPLSPPTPQHISGLLDLDHQVITKSSLPLKDDDSDDHNNGRAMAPPRPMTDFVGVGIRGRGNTPKSNNNNNNPSLKATTLHNTSPAAITSNITNTNKIDLVSSENNESNTAPIDNSSYGNWHTSSNVPVSNTSSTLQDSAVTDNVTTSSTDNSRKPEHPLSM